MHVNGTTLDGVNLCFVFKVNLFILPNHIAI